MDLLTQGRYAALWWTRLFYWVTYGYPNSAMPAWKDQLSEEQRWDAINYARATFGNPANQTANSPAANSRP